MQTSSGQGANIINQSPNQRVQKVPAGATPAWFLQQQQHHQQQQQQSQSQQQQGMPQNTDVTQVMKTFHTNFDHFFNKPFFVDCYGATNAKYATKTDSTISWSESTSKTNKNLEFIRIN